MLKPNFFIVGAPKSGTSSLYDYLKQHPGVFLPKKELYYFCRDLTFRTPPLPESVYLNYYHGAQQQKAVGDASVYYLLSPDAARQIKEFNPESKIIILLRNPLEMVYSLHSQLYFNGDEPIENFEEALNAESSRKQGSLIPPNHQCPLEAMFYSTVAKYYEQVLRYKSVFAETNVHIILFDDFISGTEKEYQKVLKFLGLEEFMPDAFKVVNPGKVSQSKVLQSFLVNPPGFVKATGRFFFPHHSKRREWLLDRLWNMNMKFKPRPTLGNEIKERLLNIYREDIEKLGKLLNRDLSNWLKL